VIEKNDIGIYTWFGFKYPFDEIIKLIKNAGFQSVMTWWGDEYKKINRSKEMEPKNEYITIETAFYKGHLLLRGKICINIIRNQLKT